MGALDAELLLLLRCPVSHQRLVAAPAEVLSAVNARLGDGRLDAALMREDGSAVYPVRDGIPVLLAEEAMAL